MFKNMTPRERFLALSVGSLLPLLLVYWGFSSFTRGYFANRVQITGIRNQIMDQQDLQSEAAMAQQRRFFYRDHSLPSNANIARIEYQAWLEDMLSNKAGLKVELIKPIDAKPIHYSAKAGSTKTNIAQQFSWEVTAKGNLAQLLTMLREFKKLEMTHRISAININPLTVGGTGNEAANRTGLLKISAQIDAISMVDSDATRDFKNDLLVDEGSLQKMSDAILVRNMFGPANIPPRITSSTSKSAETGELVTFDITAEDPDELNGVGFELVDCKIEGAILKPTDNPMKVLFEAPALPVGKHTFLVRATDNGFPSKSSEKSYSLTVNEKRIVEDKPEPGKPAFHHAQATRITGITTDRTGRTTCWIHVQTTNDRYQPAVDESFELDKQKWTVKEIKSKSKQVVFEVDNNLVTVSVGSTLDKPVLTEALTTTKAAEDDAPPLPEPEPAIAAKKADSLN